MLRVTIKTDTIPKKIIHFKILLNCEKSAFEVAFQTFTKQKSNGATTKTKV
jgi:hypothetical protein